VVEYDIVEVLHDRSLRWSSRVKGTTAGLVALEQVSRKTINECFAIHVSTQTILARVKSDSEGTTVQDHQDHKDPIRPASQSSSD
jgi:hypothetical protein